MREEPLMDAWFEENLRCPLDKSTLHIGADELLCTLSGHCYKVIDGIPIMLVPQARPTITSMTDSLGYARGALEVNELLEKSRALESSPGIDPFVSKHANATCGIMYKRLNGHLTKYPVGNLRITAPTGSTAYFLDIGCGWGRWSISAAQLGYLPIGIDPWLEMVLAARRVARKLGIKALYLVADARYLPFASDTFPVVFSYSVLQQFIDPDLELALGEAGRVLKPAGLLKVEMANLLGLRGLYSHVRYYTERREALFATWRRTPWRLRSLFTKHVGPARLSADGYFTIDPQPGDLELLPRRYRFVVNLSERLRALSEQIPDLVYFADSVYVEATKEGKPSDLESAEEANSGGAPAAAKAVSGNPANT
jgi:ubiquinone/menaquinone biosynthesis C-methylase UbiE/uncharacterized protein YbaR (Trm112 family)